MAIFLNQQFLPSKCFPRPLAMAIFPNQRFLLPSKGFFHDDADAEAFMEKVSRECAALVLDELIPSTIFKSTATNGLIIGGKTTTSTAGGSGGNGYSVVKSLTASNISGLKEPWQYELEDHHVKGSRVLFPRGTAIAMIGKQKSNPIKDIAALTQPNPNYNDEKMKGKDKKKETIFMENKVVEDEDGVLYIQISDDIRLPVEWPYEKYP